MWKGEFSSKIDTSSETKTLRMPCGNTERKDGRTTSEETNEMRQTIENKGERKKDGTNKACCSK